jgi:hypothetical protein
MHVRHRATLVPAATCALVALLSVHAAHAASDPSVRDRAGTAIRSLPERVPAALARPAATPLPQGFTVPRAQRSVVGARQWVDPDGQAHTDTPPAVLETVDTSATATAPLAVTDIPPPLAAVTIDSMTTANSASYVPYREFRLLGSAQTYYLSDGTSWSSGAGSYYNPYALFLYAETHGDTILYFFEPQPDSMVYSQTDYSYGNHSAQGTLSAYTPLVMRAINGSTTATLSGYVRITDNTMSWYGEPSFNFYSAIPGSIVPFRMTYTCTSGAWTFGTLDAACSYTNTGLVDFAHPLSMPALQSLTLRGSRQVPAGQASQFGAVATFVGGVQRDVRNRSTWSVLPAGSASVFNGLLTVPTFPGSRLDLQLTASYSSASGSRTTTQSVAAMNGLDTPDPHAWPQYQADFAHTGYRPLVLNPALFTSRWQRTPASGFPLNPVTAAGGGVFCSIQSYFPAVSQPEAFALNSNDGSTRWSKAYGSIYSVNPPAFAYGNVYIQTGDNYSDTWLHSLDATTGDVVFDSPHDAQWERYLAPTIREGKVYVDGGSYGGMYRFDAFSGAQDWSNFTLPQYDGWTPALDDSNAYAYLGDYAPGLYVISRTTGLQRFSIMDPSFSWNGYTMGTSPVVCGNGNVIAAHDTRLLCFNIPTHLLAWQLNRAFSGQPAYHAGVIYAIDGGKLVAISEVTHANLWTWSPPNGGSIGGALVVTDSHVLASTGSATFAVNLVTHATDWAYGAGGALAIADNTLYIASGSGTLFAVNAADFAVATTLQRFDAAADPGGIRLTWQFADPAQVAATTLTRAEFESGPWTVVDAGAADPDGTVQALDRDVEPGHSYWYRLSADFTDGTSRAFGPLAVRAATAVITNQLRVLAAASPGGPMTVRFGTARDGAFRVVVMDVSGRHVGTLASGWSAGTHDVPWAGEGLETGIYFVRLDAPGYHASRKVVVAH